MELLVILVTVYAAMHLGWHYTGKLLERRGR